LYRGEGKRGQAEKARLLNSRKREKGRERERERERVVSQFLVGFCLDSWLLLLLTAFLSL